MNNFHKKICLFFIVLLISCSNSVKKREVNNNQIVIKESEKLNRSCQEINPITHSKKNSQYPKHIKPYLPLYIPPYKEVPINAFEGMRAQDKQKKLPDSLKNILYNKTITCNFENESLGNVVSLISKSTNTRILLDPNVDKEQQITLFLEEVSFRGTLSIILAFTGLDYTYKDDALLLTNNLQK